MRRMDIFLFSLQGGEESFFLGKNAAVGFAFIYLEWLTAFHGKLLGSREYIDAEQIDLDVFLV